VRTEGNPDRNAAEERVERLLADARYGMRTRLYATNKETLGTALSWFRDRTLETYLPVWLFLTHPQERLIGVGWRGLLVIWRSP